MVPGICRNVLARECMLELPTETERERLAALSCREAGAMAVHSWFPPLAGWPWFSPHGCSCVIGCHGERGRLRHERGPPFLHCTGGAAPTGTPA